MWLAAPMPPLPPGPVPKTDWERAGGTSLDDAPVGKEAAAAAAACLLATEPAAWEAAIASVKCC